MIVHILRIQGTIEGALDEGSYYCRILLYSIQFTHIWYITILYNMAINTVKAGLDPERGFIIRSGDQIWWSHVLM
jgi:hypothetical protein